MTHDATTPGTELCVCGHAHEAHEHYRKGTDCAVCGAGQCIKFTLGPPTTAAPQPDTQARPAAGAPRL
ncbi:hypothetical protein B0I08_101542 [Glaciihabitans tibetensis]|uniref:Uncharacterized protein n=1 Tax=Glaciihabitans tibetensis TaxID=1266600 RepID=A0A2T0VJL4_9MICO|nr:hypothetical protein B0I08_101542 [Glaciihabitans tibetensis]